jgi:N-acetylmuramoyl-L-alanine amidase CwlA
MEQLAWTLSHHISERRVRRGYHFGIPTWRTNQLFLKPQPWQSSDQIEFTQARQKVKAQVTQLPMPRPQLTRRASQETTLNTRRLRKISSKHLTLKNDHTDKVPSRVQNPRTTRPKQHLKALIQKLGHKKQIVSKRLNKSNTPESDPITHLNLTF